MSLKYYWYIHIYDRPILNMLLYIYISIKHAKKKKKYFYSETKSYDALFTKLICTKVPFAEVIVLFDNHKTLMILIIFFLILIISYFVFQFPFTL